MASAHSEPPVRSTHRSTDQSWSHGYGEAPLPCGCRRCPVCVRACEKPRVFLWGCVGLGRECFGYRGKPLGACAPRGFLYVWCGGVLLSHTLSGAVPSPCQALASGFGMGPGVSPGPWPPQIFSCTVKTLGSAGLWRPGNRTADADMSMFRLVARQC